MSTTSTFAILRLDGSVSSIYCHNGGQLEYNGQDLFLHFQDVDKIKELISLGDMSSLAANVSPPEGVHHSFKSSYPDTCIFYGRDRGETNIDTKNYYSLEAYINIGNLQDLDYVYHEKKEQWYVLNASTLKLQKLSNLLLKEKNVSQHIKDMITAEKFAVVLNEKLPQKTKLNNKKKI